VLGQRPGQCGRAGGFRPYDDDPAGEGRPDRRGEELPLSRGIGPHGGAAHREPPARLIHLVGDGAEPSGQLRPVGLGAEHRVDPGLLAPQSAQPVPEHLDVPFPHLGGVVVDLDVVDDRREVDVRLRVCLAQPGRAIGHGDALDAGRADDHGEPVTRGRRGVDQVVVSGVRRIELADDQAVPHAGTRAFPASLCQARSPATHNSRKITYRALVRLRSL
jgi:hypothetical protein